ncbi:telomere-associated protein RIF1 isoform X2 [Achroia grisella]|uniref:telomere-associated protein RIF1 isoform X2 n=1 Tax=Achroia grisella TaxID=688607 RepID=UPI0027D24AB3|nr:telomere-associated protein RIF1 isoform X2 [Achroia grisella]
MPEEMLSVDLNNVLDILEDNNFNTYITRNHNFKLLVSALENGVVLSGSIVDRILSVCEKDLKDEKKHCINILKIINIILKKVEVGELSPPQQLLSSALAIVHVMKTTALLHKVESMQIICWETFLAYPDSVFISIATSHTSELIEIFNLYIHSRNTIAIRRMLCDVVLKLTKVLPQEQKTIFIHNFLSVCFKLIPTIFECAHLDGSTNIIETLEVLTEELKTIDYTNNPEWEILFESIYNPKKLPASMEKLLENGCPTWHRLWIAAIKLLKNQITRNNTNVGSPINSLLPVVEKAFKMDAENRCRAFQCWEVLIDNFLPEPNEVYLTKRLKLLLIPLHSNNAKSEDIVIAKFNTWWHLIRQSQNKIDKFIEKVIISFLNFCFGKNVVSDKTILVPGLLSKKTKNFGIEALTEIAGHLKCHGCGKLPKLNTRIISTKHLVSYWNHLAYFLQKSIQVAVNESIGITAAQVLCLWNSFVLTIGELPENNIRKDIFTELLTVLVKLIQDCEKNYLALGKMSDMVLSLVYSLFEHGNDTVDMLLKTKLPKDDNDGPMYKIIQIILGPASNFIYKSDNIQGSIDRLKPVTNFVMNGILCCPNDLVEWILKNMHPNDNTFIIWIALSESVYESNMPLSEKNLHELLMWPVQSVNKFSEIRFSGLKWYGLYDTVYSKIKTTNATKEISKILSSVIMTKTNKYFLLSVTLALVKHKLLNTNSLQMECQKEIEILIDIVNTVENYESIEEEFPILVDVLVLLMDKRRQIENESLMLRVMTVIIEVINLLAAFSENSVNSPIQILVFLETLLNPVKKILKSKMYPQLDIPEKEKLMKSLCTISKNPSLKSVVVDILKSWLYETKEDSIVVKTVLNAIEYNGNTSTVKVDKEIDKKDFTSPKLKKMNKSIKRDTKILNTVVENGEEYVVVKSNWKFNPKKLTEVQKEKLQRKREDIPALYQDLSQSQDDFKLTNWKTDSQDTSTSNSKSSNIREEVSSLLMDIPSSDVVPTIIENIMSDNRKKEIEDTNSNKLKPISPLVKDVKTPRITLKDRVFRNVKILIEKSSLQNEGKDSLPECSHPIESIPKTTLNDGNNTNLIHSAPSKINTERPSRVKRKPRKFDDSELFLNVKKGRRHSIQIDSQLTDIEGTNTIEDKLTKDVNLIQKNAIIPNECSSPHEKMKDAVNKVTIFEEKGISSDRLINSSCDSAQDCQIQLQNSAVNNLQAQIEKSILSEPDITDKQNISVGKKSLDSLDDDDAIDIITPKENKTMDLQQSTQKKRVRKSRIEKELAIDMVEGHPFLKVQSEKRLTRKNINNCINSGRRKNLTDKLNKSKTDLRLNTKIPKKTKEKENTEIESSRGTSSTSRSQSKNEIKNVDTPEDLPCSEDVIESSQDSSITTVSTKSTRQVNRRLSIAKDPVTEHNHNSKSVSETQNLLNINSQSLETLPIDQECNDDTNFLQNKTALDSRFEADLTENMDTEPIHNDKSGKVIMTSYEMQPIVIDMENSFIGTETQELADANTQPTNNNDFPQVSEYVESRSNTLDSTVNNLMIGEHSCITTYGDISLSKPDKDINVSIDDNGASSPLKNEVQRKKDFLDNTLEISPIKTMSPVRDKKSPSPETSSDFVVIKLTSPVQSNGEPFDKCESPEIFTDDKISPDKRDQSPPRQEINVNNNTSPSSSLSLKKNKPQVRTGGRAAQMLGLCMPVTNRLQTITNLEKSEPEDSKKCNINNTQARRNLRILYNSVSDNNEHLEENEDNKCFLKLKRTLPTSDKSPSGPILKRKLAEIADDATVSPVSKRKRVSFHDPPVSTTISVQKYIEPSGIRSPQSSGLKRQERQTRSQTNMKSPKRLDNVFKLETVLTKAVERFNEIDQNMSTDDTPVTSLDETPSVEVVKTSDLNNVDPICPDLIDCTDPIDIIAGDLSSSTMKLMFLKELEEKIVTIGDLAKMTELEINRLCIKAPKVKIARKVLTEYALKQAVPLKEQQIGKQDLETVTLEPVLQVKSTDVDVQTDATVTLDVEMQTVPTSLKYAYTQTEKAISDIAVQTNESGRQPTNEVIASCLLERPDFIQKLKVQLKQDSKKCIAESLPLTALTDSLLNQVTDFNAQTVISKVLERVSETSGSTENRELTFLMSYLCDKFQTSDLILFCSKLLQNIHNKPL